MKAQKLPAVSLVGPGRAGKAFGRSWVAAGGQIVEVVGRSLDSARGGREAIGAGTARVASAKPIQGDILIIAVPDDEIAGAAQSLAGRFPGTHVFHLSGALPASILGPLGSQGSALGSLHPARVFTGAASENWKGSFIAVEGDSSAVEEGERIVRAIGGIPRRITASAKPLYHLAAALAAGGTAALIGLATRAWQEAGIPGREARPALATLARQAAAAAASRDFEAVLTGPIARRDLGTVALHAKALKTQPALALLYEVLGREILERTPGRGREAEIRALLEARVTALPPKL
ncbi:MAG TPA: DUF2520 domain-containing protein [Thermoanaerobaculia bacterium]|nr:DUF2520 domain-containing protein [Thermoanaerobaculia bacterium]